MTYRKLLATLGVIVVLSATYATAQIFIKNLFTPGIAGGLLSLTFYNWIMDAE